MGQLKEGELGAEPEIIQDAYEYLSTQASLWGNWLVAGADNERNRLKAARWLVKQAKGLAFHTDLATWDQLFAERDTDGTLPVHVRQISEAPRDE